MNIEGILLAAGGSTRLGQPKQLLMLNNQTLVERTVTTMHKATNKNIIVVTGGSSNEVSKRVEEMPVQVIFNQHWQTGMASSIKTGIEYVLNDQSTPDAILICLCDQPFLTTHHLKSLIAAFQKKPQKIVASYYKNLASVPSIFPKTIFDTLLSLKGQEGARKVIRKLEKQLITLPFPDGVYDVDTPKAWENIQAKFYKSNK